MTVALLRAAGAAAQAGRRRTLAGGVAPTITVAPVLTWTVEIGTSPAIAPPTYTGDAGTITYTLLRDGVPVASFEDVSEAALEAYVGVAADIGPEMDVVAEVVNGSGSDSEISNTVLFDDATYLPETAIWCSDEGRTDVGGECDVWVSSYGGVACTLTAPASTNRPDVSSGGIGGRALLTTDGSNDVMEGTITKGSAWADYEQGFLGFRTSFNAITYFILGWLEGLSTRWSFSERSATVVRFNVGNGINQDVTITNGVTLHLVGRSASGTQNVDIDGTNVASGAATTTSRTDPGTVRFGSSTACPLISAQALHMGAHLSSTQRSHLRALLTYLTGHAA